MDIEKDEYIEGKVVEEIPIELPDDVIICEQTSYCRIDNRLLVTTITWVE